MKDVRYRMGNGKTFIDALNETKDFKNSLWSYVNILDTKSKTFLYGTSS